MVRTKQYSTKLMYPRFRHVINRNSAPDVVEKLDEKQSVPQNESEMQGEGLRRKPTRKNEKLRKFISLKIK